MAHSICISYATSIALSYIEEALSTATMPSPRPSRSGDNIVVAQSTLVNPLPLQQAISLQNSPEASLGTENRMPSGRIASCTWQLDKDEAITPENMNFMLAMFRDSFPDNLCIQPAACLESLHLRNAQKLFIVPILDTVDEGKWSLIHVLYQHGDPEMHSLQRVEVQYYDSGCAPGRSNIIRKKLASWVEHAYGRHMGFRFIEAKGPVDQDNPNMSGIHVIMAAREFAHYGSVTTKSSSWGSDPKDLLKNKLRQQEHQSPHYPPVAQSPGSKESSLFISPTSDSWDGQQDSSSSISSTTSATTPSTSPIVSQRKRPHGVTTLETTNKIAASDKLAAENGCNNPKAILRPRNSQCKVTSTKPASPSSTSAAICNIVAPQTNGCADEPCSEPSSKRRCVEKETTLSSNVTEKMAEIALFIQDRGLPALDALQQERERLYAELAYKEKASKKMEDEMNLCDNEYEQRKKEHRSFVQHCETIETNIKTWRDWLQGCVRELPSPPSLDNRFGATDVDISEAFSTTIETKYVIPLQDKLTDNLGRKRKAGEMLEAAWQVCEERQKDFDKAVSEKKRAEVKSREACKREELTVITESFVKKTRACNKAWETVEGGGNKDWYGAFCRRRALI